MIRRVLGLVAAVAMVGPAIAARTNGAPFLGYWARGDGKTHIRVEQCGGSICGVNTWVKPGATNEKVGDKLVLQVEPAGGSLWSGSAFDPQRNQRYTIKVEVSNARMTTNGCMLGGLMCQSMTWTRLRHS